MRPVQTWRGNRWAGWAVAVACVGCAAVGVGSATAGPQVATQDDVTVVKHDPVPAPFANPSWTPEMEAGFWKRAAAFIEHGKATDRTTGEGEKWGYPASMLAYLKGDKAGALAALQAEDVDAAADHKHTLGIDWYWSFTIKGQVRKFFQFGDELKPDYLKRMTEAARLWTAEDPRPNFELVLLLNDPNEQVRAYALDALKRSKVRLEENWAGQVGDELHAWAKTAPPDRAKAVEQIDGVVKKYRDQNFGDDVAKWTAWWADFAQYDWMVLEEVERVMNIKPLPDKGFGRPGAIGSDFSPGARSYWVDARNTDNLRAMRETSVYLMAEATGNELTRLVYKEKLKRFVLACYSIGMGEWDSENYLAHTTMPYHNLYDFSKDPEVKALAKAFLDWVYTANAMKYYRGGFGGPTKRDYGGASRAFGSSPSHVMWLFAGDSPIKPDEPEEDIAHAILSTYRPPAAVVALARKDFPKPVEMLDTKPTYSNWFPGADAAPEFFETMYYANTYYLGTAVSAGASGDVGAFKLLADNAKRGVDYFLANSGKKVNSKNAGDQIGQLENLCVFLNGRGQPFIFQVPDTAKQSVEGEVWFVELEKTYLAVRLINLNAPAKTGGIKHKGDSYYTAAAKGGGLSGFTLIIGEAPQYRSFADFKAAVAKSSTKVDGDAVTLADGAGKTLAVTYNRQNDLPKVVRNGQARDWTKEFDCYRPAAGDGPVSLGWKTGTLTIKAGGQTFTQSVDPKTGKVSLAK
jgi:hypothetical protein